MREALIHKR